MNEQGFTLVELLASLAIISILVVIAVPAYNNISSQTRIASLENKKKAITNSMLNYANKYLLDDIKPESKKCEDTTEDGCCMTFTIEYMIYNGIYYTTEKDENGRKNEINPVTNQPLDGYVIVYYDTSKFDLDAEFIMKDADEKINRENLEAKYYACYENIYEL